jgi:hypothetical protein
MFLFYQIRTLTHTTTDCPGITCPLCGKTGGVRLSIRQRYAWLLGPIAPSPKFGLASCSNCGQQIPAVQWTDELEKTYRTELSKVKTPLRLWRGTWMIPLVIALVVTGGSWLLSQRGRSQQKKATLFTEYVTHPQDGDLYRIVVPGKNGATYYSYAKYLRTAGNTIFVALHRQLNPADRQWEGMDTGSADAFDVQEIPVSRTMLEQSALLSVPGRPNMTMTVWAMERNGTLVSRF